MPFSLSLAGKAAAAAIAIGSVGAYEWAPSDTREQTIFIERLALRIENARVIAPDTATQVSDLLARAQARPVRGGDVDARREQAIARIEAALQAKMALAGGRLEAQSSPVARR